VPTVEIFDRATEESEGLRHLVGMDKVVATLDEFALRLDWYVVEMFVNVLTDGEKEWILELCKRSAVEPIAISWQEIVRFGKEVGQVESCVLIGVRPGGERPVEPIDLNSKSWGLVIQNVDTTFWAITSHDQTLLERVRASFKESKTVESTQRYF
jgi:hypothetical protein